MESSTGDNESFNVNSGYWLLAQLMDDILVDIYSASKKVHIHYYACSMSLKPNANLNRHSLFYAIVFAY